MKVDWDYECPSCEDEAGVTAWPVVLFICGWYGFRCSCGEAILVAEFRQCRSRYRQDGFVSFCSKEKDHASLDHLADDWCGTGWTTEEEMEE